MTKSYLVYCSSNNMSNSKEFDHKHIFKINAKSIVVCMLLLEKKNLTFHYTRRTTPKRVTN